MQTAKLFANGQSQAVRLPKDCRFTGDEVYTLKIGDVVMLFPIERNWELFLEGLNGFTNDYFEAISAARSNETPSPRELL